MKVDLVGGHPAAPDNTCTLSERGIDYAYRCTEPATTDALIACARCGRSSLAVCVRHLGALRNGLVACRTCGGQP